MVRRWRAVIFGFLAGVALGAYWEVAAAGLETHAAAGCGAEIN